MNQSEDKNRRKKDSDRREVSRMDVVNDRRFFQKDTKTSISKEDIAKLSLRELEEEILANSLEISTAVDEEKG